MPPTYTGKSWSELMTTLKTVDEVAQKVIDMAFERGCTVSKGHYDSFKEELTQDRATLHTSLVEAVEGKEHELNVAEYLPKVKAWIGGYDQPFDDGYAQGKKDTLTIINSIFKE